LQYHSNHKGFCIRCDVQKRPKVYLAKSLHNKRAWLSRGVSRGKWGLGCILCAKKLQSGLKSQGQRFASFAKFGFRPTSVYHCSLQIEQHLASKSHRAACGIDSNYSSRPVLSAKLPKPQPDVSAKPPKLQPLPRPSRCSTDMPDVTAAEDFGRPSQKHNASKINKCLLCLVSVYLWW